MTAKRRSVESVAAKFPPFDKDIPAYRLDKFVGRDMNRFMRS